MTALGYIQLSTEVTALVTSVYYFRHLWVINWQPWIPFLICTCTVEIWGTYISEVNNGNNLWLYNPYIILCNAFYSWFLIHISILSNRTKKKLYFLITLAFVSSLIWYVIWGDPKYLVNYILNVGALTICILCLLFFITQIQNPMGHLSLVRVPGFWIASGLLIFYSGISLYTAIYNFLAESGLKVWHVKIQNLIPQVLSLILYITITMAFIYERTNRAHNKFSD